ncbi:hypothetical protein OAJ84_03735 [Candidatus Puniceispirillum sp.]|nr:hypothetical protein [Candidatus Puniceispirillum sp.]
MQPNSGEGRLALLYMLNAFDLKIESVQKQSLLSSEPGDVLTPVLVNRLRWRRAVSAYLWLLWQVVQLHFVRKADVVVLNYLPLWNIFFFLLVPKTVALAPITGGGRVNSHHLGVPRWQRVSVSLTRNILIPSLYKMSAMIIRCRSLVVKPATPAVNVALGYNDVSPRFIETDHPPFKAADPLSAGTKRSVDVIAYIGPHLLKNSRLTIQVMNSLASDGLKVILIGPAVPGLSINNNVDHYPIVDHKTVLRLMSTSMTLLSLSLEHAGFFSFEAAASGCVVLCLPNSGGATLPGAVLLAEENEQASVDLFVARCKTAIKTARVSSSYTASHIAAETRKAHKVAKAFFYQNI